MQFKAIVVNKDEQGYRASQENMDGEQLRQMGEVLVAVEYSTINYKDALAITGKAPVVRSFPMVLGIDFCGKVVESSSQQYEPGDAVLLNGWGVGEKHWGGLAQRACVDADWLIPLPDGLTPSQAMAIGTAGYTAMLCVLAIEDHGIEAGSEILVTGATGGVGSIAISLLAKRGFKVTASTGKPSSTDYLTSLGASEVIDRSTLSEPGKPLAKERWAAAVDTLGGNTLANACSSIKYGAIAAACAMAQSLDFPASVAPFILRGVTLAGIDSVQCPREKRMRAWQQLARDVDMLELSQIETEIGLSDVIDAATKLSKGLLHGRLVVDVHR